MIRAAQPRAGGLRLRIPFVLLLAALLLAGCASPETVTPAAHDAPNADPPAATPSHDAAAPTPASPASTAPSANASGGSGTAAAAPAPKTLPVKAALSFVPGACAFVLVAGLCPGVPMGGPEFSRIGAATRVLSGTITMTWSETTPATHELGFALANLTSCGQGCTALYTLDVNTTFAHGASPLKIEVKTPLAVPGGQLGVFINKPCEVAQPPAFACAYPPQDVAIEGSLVVEA